MLCINVCKRKSNYISLEHLDDAGNHHGSSICHPFHVSGGQVPQFVSQKPQINHCLGGLSHLHLANKFVYVLANVPHEVLETKSFMKVQGSQALLKHIIYGSLPEETALCGST